MPEDRLTGYIKAQMENGFSAEEIKNALLKAGWKEEDVKAAFNGLQMQPQTPQPEPKAKPRLYLIILIIIIAAIAIPIIVFLNPLRNPPGDAQNQTLREDISSLSMAYLSKDIRQCLPIESAEFRDYCGYAVSLKALDPGLCSELQEKIRMQCLRAVAVKKSDYTICNMIRPQSSERSGCIYQIVEKTKDRGICSGLDSTMEPSRDACIIQTIKGSDEPAICDGMAANLKEDCIAALGQAKKDTGLCSGIRDQAKRTICMINSGVSDADFRFCESESFFRSECIVQWALGTSNPDICGKDDNSLTRNICIFLVAKALNDTGVCSRLEAEDRLQCISQAAYESGNITACTLIPKGTEQEIGIREDCIVTVSSKLRTESACQLPGTRDRESCMAGIALAMGDPDYCASLINEDIKVHCGALALVNVDSAARCPASLSAGDRNACINNVAYNIKDPSICLGIWDDGMLESCARGVMESIISG